MHTPGDVLVGKYRLDSLVGQGGMGVVWRARSLTLDIDVAVKVVHHDGGFSAASDRLLREARAAASIGHPGIVRVLDFGVTEADEPFLVMELLSGESLGDWLEREPRLSPQQAVQLLLPVASALAAAHAQGLVHRDIKPENIFIAHGDEDALHPKLLDFGIVKLAGSRAGKVLTEVGMLMGSPEYMSPEQAQGAEEIGPATDVWSLCVMLYEMIAGRRPFTGAHAGAVLISVFRDTPVPTTSLAAGDEELWAIIRRGLEKDPADRWEGIRELGVALGAWAGARGIETDSAGASIARQWLGVRTNLSSGPPRRGDSSRAVPAQTVTFERASGARKATSTSSSVLEQQGSSSTGSQRRTALIALGGAAVIAGVAFLGLRRATPVVASADAPASGKPVASPVDAAAPVDAVAPVVVTVAIPTSVPSASASAPLSASASSSPAAKRPPPPSTVPAPLSHGGKSTMPLPGKPNF